MPNYLRRTIGIFFLAACFASANLSAYASDSVFMTDAQLAPFQKTLKRVETYLSDMHTIIADFTQIAPDGALSTGRFYMERPGKMRWQYHPPTPILIVSNGSELVFYDYELEQISYLPLDRTVMGFMAREVIRFSDTVGVLNYVEDADSIRITLAQRENPDDGTLTLELTDKPLLLRNMIITDATKQVTSVALNNARFDVKIDGDLFIFRDPRKRKKY